MRENGGSLFVNETSVNISFELDGLTYRPHVFVRRVNPDLDLTELLRFLTFKEIYRRWLMNKEAVLKDFPGIPNDALLAYFLFFMG